MEGMDLQKGCQQYCVEKTFHPTYFSIRHVRGISSVIHSHRPRLDDQCRYYADDTAKSGKGSFDVDAILSVNQQQVPSRLYFLALAITVTRHLHRARL